MSTTSPSEHAINTKPLLDVQSTPDVRGIALQRVGVSHVELPMQILDKHGGTQAIATISSMTVDLPPESKGTHMSRFIEIANRWGKDKVFSLNVREFLEETCDKLHAQSAYLDMRFKYFIEKQAPVSGLSAPMGYDCRFRSALVNGTYEFILGVDVPMSTLCPCSKAISEFGAHNQRAHTRAQLIIDPTPDHPVIWIEDVVHLLEAQASCPVFPMLKRSDEKWVTERQYTNPKFVEDVLRDSILALREMQYVNGFHIEVEALESIHGHNAYAAHCEQFNTLQAMY